MQTLFRVINVVLGPLFTLLFAAHFAGLKIAGREAGDLVGGAIAGLVMLAMELGLTQGPKRSRWLRRWLDPRAAFEGVWLQDVIKGHEDNGVAVFSVDYERDSDTFSVHGHAYSLNGRLWAKWNSTHVFIDAPQLRSTYLWDGEVLGKPTPSADKTGLGELKLRRPPALSLPMTGDGGVSHIGETTRLEFRLQRVTNLLLKEHGMPFAERDIRVDAHDEERQLVAAFLRRRADIEARRPSLSTPAP